MVENSAVLCSKTLWPLITSLNTIIILKYREFFERAPKNNLNTLIAEGFLETGPFMNLSNHVFPSQ